jgi:tetratricopeptide (TPR) repeat protein
MTDYRASVATTWQTSIGRLGILSRYILNIIAFFAPDPIPRLIFRELRSALSAYLHSPMELRILRRALSASNAVDLALAELATYSLLSLSEETCRAHPLLQTVVRDSARPEERIFFNHVLRWFYHFPDRKAWSEALWPLRAASFLNRDSVLPSPEGDALVRRLGDYIPHIEAILTCLPKSRFGSFVDPAQLHSIVSDYREHLAGVAALRSILTDRLGHLPDVRRELQWFFENLDGFLDYVPKKAGGGEPQIFWSLRFLVRENEEHQLQSAYRMIDDLADAQASTGKTATARRLFHLLIMLTSSTPGADACATAGVRLAEAKALWNFIPRDETLQLLANGLEIFEKENNLKRGDVFNGIQLYAIFAQTNEEKWRACQWLRQAIPLAEDYLQYGGGYACGLVLQLAQIATDCKMADEALAMCEHILRVALRCPKLRRQELGPLWHARALLLSERGTFLSAARCYVRALSMERQDPNLTVFQQAQLLKEAAEMFRKAERPAMSIPLLLESASLLDKGWEKEAANIEMLAALTGLELGRLGQIPVGEKLLRRAIASRAKRHGDNSSTLWAAHRLLGIFLHDAGRLPEAETQLRRALAILDMHPPVCNQTLARILADLVALLTDMERDEEALALVQRRLQLGEHEADDLV